MLGKKTAAAALTASVVVVIAGARAARADGMVPGMSEEVAAQEARTSAQPPSSGESMPSARMTARLVDQKANEKKSSAQVEVKVEGVDSPRLQYKVDDGPALETSDTKVGIRGLKPGEHRISIILENGAGSALGPSETLSVTVP